MHLSLYQLNRYRLARLAPAELLSLDDHVTTCEFCRQQLRANLNPAAALFALRTNLQTVPELEHVSAAELNAFLNNALPAVERELVTSHLEVCLPCATELQSQRQSSFTPKRASVFLAWLEMWRERLALIWPMPVAAAFVLAVVALADYFYARPNPAPPAIVQREVVPSPTPTPVEIQPETKSSVIAPVQIARLQFPAELQALRGTAVTRGSKPTATFRMLSPIGTFVFHPRPTLRWQPLANATSYAVQVFSSDYELIAESPALTATAWILPQPLERGKTYIWQVTARQNDENIAASSSFAEAKFAVLDRARAQAIVAAKRTTNSPLALSAAYARAGLLDDAEAALQTARKTAPQAAQKLLQQIARAR